LELNHFVEFAEGVVLLRAEHTQPQLPQVVVVVVVVVVMVVVAAAAMIIIITALIARMPNTVFTVSAAAAAGVGP